MRLIIDTNQADPIRKSYQKLAARTRPTIVIPHLVWIELQYGPDAEKRRYALKKFPLQFGMDEFTIYDYLAIFSEDRIRRFVPVYPRGSEGHQWHADTFQHPERSQLRKAAEIKAYHQKKERAFRQRDS